ncbi:Uncharacterized protein Fot_00055 [Forsythia ovata]|uniref:Uncharacterized protein n=1 Tax=Forsythia ovata TaxID=205694 RepID=A0ABD1X005_9LAMI
MGRGGKKEEKTVASNPEAEERKRLKKLAFSKSILSENSSRVGPSSALAPSKIVTKHHGKDILRSCSGRTDFFSRFRAFSVRFLVENLASSKTLARETLFYISISPRCRKYFLENGDEWKRDDKVNVLFHRFTSNLLTGKLKANSVRTQNFLIFDVLMDMFDKADSQFISVK